MDDALSSGRTGVSVLYLEVKRQLIADIQSARVAPGGALPSESELAKRFKVSIGTVRRAVDELVAEKLLIRQQGRGTFVGRQDRARFMFQFFKIAGRDGSREFPTVRLHSFAKSRASLEEAQALKLRGTPAVFRIHNVLTLKGRPVIHDHIVIAAAMFPGLTKTIFERRDSTIYALYQTAYGVTIVGASERIRAEGCDELTAQLLDLPGGTPVLRIERVALTFNQQPVEYRISKVDTQDVDYVARMDPT